MLACFQAGCFFFLTWLFLFKNHLWKCHKSDYSGSYSIELEPLTSHLLNFRIWEDKELQSIHKVTSVVAERPYNHFEVIETETRNSKNWELSHHLHNTNCPNQWAVFMATGALEKLCNCQVILTINRRRECLILHTLSNKCYSLMKHDIFMSNHLKGKENHFGSINTQFIGLAGG